MVSTTSSDTESAHSAPFAVGASARATIAATPEQLWAWIADPTRHPVLAGSGEPQSITVVGGKMQGVGTQFEAQQRMFGLLPYVSHSEVVVFEPHRRFRFQVNGAALWDFELQPVAGGTLVTHRHRIDVPTEGAIGLGLRVIRPILVQRTRQNAGHMARTLQNLAQQIGALPPTDLQVSYDAPILA
jgi:hypothetical protein